MSLVSRFGRPREIGVSPFACPLNSDLTKSAPDLDLVLTLGVYDDSGNEAGGVSRRQRCVQIGREHGPSFFLDNAHPFEAVEDAWGVDQHLTVCTDSVERG